MLGITYHPFLSCNWFAESSQQRYETLEWKGPECILKYSGKILFTHCHGKGILEYEDSGGRVTYNGHFYESNKQGYGTFSFPTGDEFQGLFKDDTTFGPGVFTQANGFESRGLWVGQHLMRLCDTYFDHIVPTLAESPAGKKKLKLYYRTLIDLRKPIKDRVRDALRAFNAPPEVEKNIHFLYNYHLRNPGCLAYDQRPYLEAFYGSVDNDYEAEGVEFDEEDGESTADAKTVPDDKAVADADANAVAEADIEVVAKADADVVADTEAVAHIDAEAVAVADVVADADANAVAGVVAEPVADVADANTVADVVAEPDAEAVADVVADAVPDAEAADKPETTNLDELKPEKKQVVPTHLLAWNNSHLIIKIQEHCFKNRNFEKFVSADIRGIIEHTLDIPRSAGDHHTMCYKFLNACASGDAFLASAMIKYYDISPDVSDGCGNTGFFFAAAGDNLDLIDVMSKSGANPDLCNDEGFTALTLCLTRYLAVINKVESWEKAFLPPEYRKIHEGAVILEWPPGKFLRIPKVVDKVPAVTVRKESTKGRKSRKGESLAIQEQTKFIFNLDPIPPPEVGKGKRKSSAKKKDKKKSKEEEANRLLEEEEMKERARVILKTVGRLLKNGANPNNSDVPRPPLILAIYSKDIDVVKMLLKMKADPNRPTAVTDGGLSPLHILGLMLPCPETLEMCEVLLEYGANPNVRAEMDYSEEDRVFDFTCGECKCHGKNVLHAVCLRPDANLDKTQFLRTMLQMLVEKGNADCEALYLGNSPLTLALIRGNMELLKTLLETRKANPNQQLTAKVAVPLGVLLTRSGGTDKLPENAKLEMCKDLLDYGADPLLIIKIEDRFEGNLVELGYNELDRMIAEKKSTKHTSKKEDPVTGYRKIVDLVCHAATQNMVKAIQKKMAFVLLHAVLEKEAMYLPTSLQFAASWLTTDELIEHWTAFTSETQLLLNPVDVENVLMSVDLMESESREDQVEDVLEALKDVLIQDNQELVGELTPEQKKEKARSKSKPRNLPTNIDMTAEKYQVCFECGRRVGEEAIVCPICNIIKFCSEKCNQSNDKKEGLHKCLAWAEKLKSGPRTASQDALLKKGSRDGKRRTTKGKEMDDLERLLHDSDLALMGKTEGKKKSKKKSREGEEDKEEDGETKQKKKKKKSTEEDGEKEEKEEKAKKDKKGKKKKKLEDESEVDEKDEKKKKKKGKKGEGEDKEDSQRGKDKKKKKGKEGDSDKKKKAGKKERGSSVESTDEEGRRKSKKKGRKSETSEEEGKRKRTLSRHTKREDSAKRSRAEQRALSEKRETARDRKSKGMFGGHLDDEDLDKYDNFLQYVSGSAALGFDLRKLLLPYTVLRDGSLYYKLYGEKPLFTENYSHN